MSDTNKADTKARQAEADRSVQMQIFQYQRELEAANHGKKAADAENAMLRKKLDRAERRLRNALIPLAILLFPITIILVVKNALRTRKKGAPSKTASTAAKNSVMDAYFAFFKDGLPAALRRLEDCPKASREAAVQLFSSLGAETDDDWLVPFNKFLAEVDQAPITLSAGKEPRFQRIIFSEPAQITDGPQVSVIMPTFNCEDTVETAVRSILNQSWRNLQLITVDDCSSDGTVEILNRLAQEDDRLCVLQQAENGGPYVAKNRAISVATGDFITGHDSDDLALPDRIEKQIQPMLDDPSVGATLGHMIRMDADGRFSWPSKISNVSFDGLHRIAFISLMLRGTVLREKLGHWDTVRFGADSEMINRATDLLGEGVVRMENLTMLCLHASEGLTSDAAHGIQFAAGLSPTRQEYADSWKVWHESLADSGHYMPFPHDGPERFFQAPEAMRVAQKTIDALPPESVSKTPRS